MSLQNMLTENLKHESVSDETIESVRRLAKIYASEDDLKDSFDNGEPISVVVCLPECDDEDVDHVFGFYYKNASDFATDIVQYRRIRHLGNDYGHSYHEWEEIDDDSEEIETLNCAVDHVRRFLHGEKLTRSRTLLGGLLLPRMTSQPEESDRSFALVCSNWHEMDEDGCVVSPKFLFNEIE
jgi:hypothetical protein